ncbi:MAG: hypothetical protein AAFV07_18340, partial [Bacteroidota bacterium]
MKSYYWITLALAASLLFGCNGDKIKQLEQQNQALSAQRSTQDSLLNDFIATFNQIESNLDLIKEKQSLISVQSGDAELASSSRERIIEDVQLINELLAQNDAMIQELTAKSEGDALKMKELNRLVSRLRRQMTTRDEEIVTLKDDLASMNFTVESLSGRLDSMRMQNFELARVTEEQGRQIVSRDSQLTSQADMITEQENKINTAYYIVGSAKELKSANILAGSKKINKELDLSLFTQIDIR